MNVKTLKSSDEISRVFDIFLELRPHLKCKDSFIKQVMEQQREGYEVIAIEENRNFLACIGFRFLTTLSWGKIMYIDDFITKEKTRGKGCGRILLDYVIKIAKDKKCDAVHLDTGYTRHIAHKVYLKSGFEFDSHHLALKLTYNP
jgi:GNAT superfamily N-acetyltransferase